MKPGDLVITVSSPPDWELAEEDAGLVGLIVRAVQFEDGHPISDWCDWWVLVGADHLEDHLQPFPAENLRLASVA